MSVRVGQRWERREPVEPDDGWNVVRVVGRHGDEFSVEPQPFGEVIAVAPDALLSSYVLAEDATDAPGRLLVDGGDRLAAWGRADG